MSLFQSFIPKGQVPIKREGSFLRSPRDSSSIGKEWKYLNNGNDRTDRISDAVAAMSRKVTARDPFGGFDSFHPFKIYQLPYELRSVHSSTDYKKFRVRTGYVEMFDRAGNYGTRTVYVPVQGTGMDGVFPTDSEIYKNGDQTLAPINETLDAFLDPIGYNNPGLPSNIFMFYIQLNMDPTIFPTATLKVSGINGDTTVWGVGGDDISGIDQPMIVPGGGESGVTESIIPIGYVEFTDIIPGNFGGRYGVPVGFYPTNDSVNVGFRIIQIINRNLIDRFPDTNMRFVEPTVGAGTIEWSSTIQYQRGDVVTVTTGGSPTVTWLCMAFSTIGNTPSTPQWTKIANFTP